MTPPKASNATTQVSEISDLPESSPLWPIVLTLAEIAARVELQTAEHEPIALGEEAA